MVRIQFDDLFKNQGKPYSKPKKLVFESELSNNLLLVSM